MRARTALLPGEDPAAFQARRDAWTARLQPRDDLERLLVERAVHVSWQLDRVDRAQAVRLDDRARAAATAEADEVLALARRLFWDPRGPVALYPQFEKTIGDPMRVSWSMDIEDPDDPARLVNRLEDRLLGCAWMLDRWADLRDLLVDGHKWQPPDRFMAIRLLAKQPLDPIHDEAVRTVYLCCKAIDPEGDHELQDVSNELHAGERKRFIERINERELLEEMPPDAESARAILLSLIAERVNRLESLLTRHEDREAAAGADRFGFDDSREGEQLRRYQLGCNRALIRILDTFWKYRRETERAGSDEGDQRAGRRRRGKTDERSGQADPPTDPRGQTEELPPVSEDPAPRIDDPSPATAAAAPPVAPSSSTEPAPTAPANQPLAEQNATNEPTSPPEGPHHSLGTIALALLALLVGLGLTAVLVASVKGIETSPPPQKQGDASKSQVLFSKALQSIDRPTLAAPISGHARSVRSIGRPRDLTADTLAAHSPEDDEPRIHAPAHQSRPPNERDGPAWD